MGIDCLILNILLCDKYFANFVVVSFIRSFNLDLILLFLYYLNLNLAENFVVVKC